MAPPDDAGSKTAVTEAKVVLKARPVQTRNIDAKAIVDEIKAKYPKILARLAE